MKNDIVARSTILSITDDCTGACRITAENLETTLLGTHSYYDKEGSLQVVDPNRRSTKLKCDCGRIFVVSQKGDEILDRRMIRRPVL